MDPLSDVLRSMRLTGGIFLDAELTAPWCLASSVTAEDCAPFGAVPHNIVSWHYVETGRLHLEVAGAPPVAVERGEIVLLPHNHKHLIGSDPGLPPADAEGLIQPMPGGLARIVHGGGGERTHVMCGFLGNDIPSDPILAIMPPVLKLAAPEGATAEWIESTFRFAAAILAGGGERSAAVLGKLAELLFEEAVHRYLANLPNGETGWLVGLRDPAIGRALALLHRGLDRHWTTEVLAAEIGMSRSAFAARFTDLVGEPPMRYLGKWRLTFAARRLMDTGEPVARIAFEAGYESEAAFNRAFKRNFGSPPATWRRATAGPETANG
ncbi:MAG: AraC family transcriptional regulator [Parvibaculum sp.]|uniref:AraC family transcriptional regulator n=1 Tax=Parvibaculum sp. TaxID=2024848 RepID=UPI002716F0A0|nr:AraC family transcriptional regulator [Parvibaculum sp.]MDO8838345.1 AraC family transcriptional regulator [Parvibaculum sp.]